uniref:ATP synthase CF1 subunit delta n=1 Tax=Hypnea pseudomusciformis TaxID=1545697 RepID=UPI0027DA2748|nr:ATP synthase CF1 subunit delta [Hypnea pseudomusciformis]WCH55120.1 ATP synthase CF1 subunit delta [Hypnea pseudomusciformis]WCH55519.1 ATP synthase CF1 subunit delta [Hypnea pseudomusciformis]WCH56713.1 ATP synthase CF1 subunit delta [Hypnea pseudomusciformis]
MSSQNINDKITLPYAEALLECANKNNIIDNMNNDLSSIQNLLAESKDFRVFLNNPLTATEAKKNVITKLLLNQVNSFLLKFLLVLVERRRISLINLIIDKYFDLVYKLDSITIATVSTSVALTEAQQKALINKLKDMTSSHTVKLETNIDTSLLGGFIIQIGSKVIDTSLAGKLKNMAFYLSNT